MKNRLTRRDFGKLSVAAFGGVVAGAGLTGCGGGDKDGVKDAKKDAGKDGKQASADKNVCRGLNACKNHGAGGGNACAGQGKCATVAHHDCGTKNACKGQGGCGENPGANDCKGNGKCAVPLTGDMWKKARTQFESKMKAAGKEVGAAPAAAGS